MSSSEDDENAKGVISDSDRRDIKARLDRLGSDIGGVKGRQPKPAPEPQGAAMGAAFRLSVEMIAGVVVGGIIGYGIDHWFGVTPLGLITGFILGAATGIYNAIRVAGQMQKK